MATAIASPARRRCWLGRWPVAAACRRHWHGISAFTATRRARPQAAEAAVSHRLCCSPAAGGGCADLHTGRRRLRHLPSWLSRRFNAISRPADRSRLESLRCRRPAWRHVHHTVPAACVASAPSLDTIALPARRRYRRHCSDAQAATMMRSCLPSQISSPSPIFLSAPAMQCHGWLSAMIRAAHTVIITGRQDTPPLFSR